MRASVIASLVSLAFLCGSTLVAGVGSTEVDSRGIVNEISKTKIKIKIKNGKCKVKIKGRHGHNAYALLGYDPCGLNQQPDYVPNCVQPVDPCAAPVDPCQMPMPQQGPIQHGPIQQGKGFGQQY